MKTIVEIMEDMRENARTDDTEDQLIGQSLNWYADQIEAALADQKTFPKHPLCSAIQKMAEHLLDHCRDAEHMPTIHRIRDYAELAMAENDRAESFKIALQKITDATESARDEITTMGCVYGIASDALRIEESRS